ncbi:MAG: ribosome biogenesis GTPase Der [Candidatus Gracilibacteria bacterium]|nr:ribosome biogenesis GTPase Der [Candidatus Gracilibacteria bacterium]
MLAKITIIGRPNVGKSSFFNMFTGHKIAIVADEAGTTRDISEYEFTDGENEITYILADSGGLDFSSKNDEISTDIIERTRDAIKESDLLIWLLEYDKFTDLDERILKILRDKNIPPVVVVANKADNENFRLEAFNLPVVNIFDAFFPVSVSHNFGFLEVRKFVAKNLKEKGLNYLVEETDDSFIKLALVGRPNVGKSSLINAIVGKNRVMVKDLAGTTRDSIDTKFHYNEKDFVLIDTAGIRRLSKIGTRNIENWSVMRTERSITRSDIIAVIIDGVDGIHQQDLSVISRVLEEKKGLIIVINKWDAVLNKQNIDKEKIMGKYLSYLSEKFDFLPWVSVIFTSAVEKKRVEEILDTAILINEERKNKRVKTSIFNGFIEQAVIKHPPTGNRVAHKPKIYYGSQVDVNPPKFVLTVNNPEHFHFSYKRYLENKIRDNFGFAGTPIIIEFKGRGKTKDIVK